jgi:hypothetical protein
MADIAKGTYPARPESWQFSKTKQNKPQVEVVFMITDAAYAGAHISWFGFLTEKTIKSTFKALTFMGFEGDDLSTLNDTKPDDVEVHLVIEVEPDLEGTPRSNVRWVNDPNAGGLVSTKLEPDEAKAYARNLRAQLIGLGAKKAAPSKADDGSDEIPF